ncbi:MAG: helix-turn-helix transcriptional regulator [Anaerocolumna sp.]|jgi:DNA-binding XRE family transcriptional regulator|nr:helix-turn-helix transcriptional regulator [Anaerocolumna sp.]
MKKDINTLREESNISFGELAVKLNISKQTLTKKMNKTLDWTYQEMLTLTELFDIVDPAEYFYN